jgi:hypothetical protein
MEEDVRTLAWGKAVAFSSGATYRVLQPVGQLDASSILSWNSSLPTKLKIFCLVADCDRLCTRANLHYKNCAPSPPCESCGARETSRHILFDCSTAASTWSRLQCDTEVSSTWDIASPVPANIKAWRIGVAAVLWELWKARNDVVFNASPCTPRDVLRRAADVVAVWTHRLHASLRDDANAVSSLILSCSL